MSFFKEVASLYGLNISQSMLVELELRRLEQYLQSLGNQIEDFEVASTIHKRFESLMNQMQLNFDQMEKFVNHLYFTDKYQKLVVYFIRAFYIAGGSPDRFRTTYELIATQSAS